MQISSFLSDTIVLFHLNLYSEPETYCIYSVDYGEHYETLMASVGPNPDEIDFRGGVGGDSSPANIKPKAATNEIEVMGKP